MTEPYSAAAKPVRRPPWALVVAGLAGLAVGVLAVGGAWLATANFPGVDTREITLPDRIGDYLPLDQVEPYKAPHAAEVTARFIEEWKKSSQRLSQSHGGAAAIVRVYSDQEAERQLEVRVFRARSPYPQYVPYVDATAIGMAEPTEVEAVYDQVSCKISNPPTPAGQTPPPDASRTVSCLRTSDTLTVEIIPGGQADERPRRVAAMVDQIWRAVG